MARGCRGIPTRERGQKEEGERKETEGRGYLMEMGELGFPDFK